MKVRITIDSLDGYWNVDLPEDHDFVTWANKRRDDSGAVGWDAVEEFETGLREGFVEQLTIDIIPAESPKESEVGTEPSGAHDGCECDRCELKRLRAIVDKLPKDADGLPVVPWRGVVMYRRITYRGKPRVQSSCGFGNCSVLFDPIGDDDPPLGPLGRNIELCHSTREAAEAAGGGEEDE